MIKKLLGLTKLNQGISATSPCVSTIFMHQVFGAIVKDQLQKFPSLILLNQVVFLSQELFYYLFNFLLFLFTLFSLFLVLFYLRLIFQYMQSRSQNQPLQYKPDINKPIRTLWRKRREMTADPTQTLMDYLTPTLGGNQYHSTP